MNPPYKLFYRGKVLGYYDGLWIEDKSVTQNYSICSVNNVMVAIGPGIQIDNEIIRAGVQQIKRM